MTYEINTTTTRTAKNIVRVVKNNLPDDGFTCGKSYLAIEELILTVDHNMNDKEFIIPVYLVVNDEGNLRNVEISWFELDKEYVKENPITEIAENGFSDYHNSTLKEKIKKVLSEVKTTLNIQTIVTQLKSAGRTEDQIIQTLLNCNVDSLEIANALSQKKINRF